MEYDIDITELLDGVRDRGLPDPSLVLYYNALAKRRINFNDEIDDNIHTIGELIIQFNEADKDIEPSERKPIKLCINTDGGDVSSTLYICDVIAASKTPIWTIGTGRCYSGGGLILMAGHKRFIYEDTTFLLHDGYNGYESSAGKFSDMSRFVEMRNDRIKNFVLAHSKINADDYDKNYRRDWFMMSDEIIKYGIADKVVNCIDEVL